MQRTKLTGTSDLCVCACAHLGVEAFGILGYSVELRESEHVLLAARPVKNPQSKRRQRGKYLRRRKYTHAAVITDHRETARTLCLTRYPYQILGTKRNSVMFKKRGARRHQQSDGKYTQAAARTHTRPRSLIETHTQTTRAHGKSSDKKKKVGEIWAEIGRKQRRQLF